MELIYLLSIFGLAFAIKNLDGPWNILSYLRRALLNNKHVGIFFYKMLSCWFCTGCHAGWIIYLLATPLELINIFNFIIWSLAGGAFCYLMNDFLGRENKNE